MKQFSIAVLLILGLALTVRVAAVAAMQRKSPTVDQFVFGDSASYWALGKTIANGETYQFGWKHARVFRTPGYPVVLATLFTIAGDDCPVWVARVTNALLGLLTVAGVMWMACVLFGRRQSLVAGLIVAVYPGAIAMSTFVLAEAAFCPLMVLNLTGWIKAVQATTTRTRVVWALVAGVAAGLATLVRPSWLLFLPFAGALGLLFWGHRRQQLSVVLLIGLAWSLTMVPWWVRNYQVIGHFVPTTLQTGASLYDGLHAEATGGSDMSFFGPERTRFLKERLPQQVVEEYESTHAAETEMGNDWVFVVPAVAESELADSFEYDFDRYLKGRALDWAKSHPVEVFELGIGKLWRMWGVGVDLGNEGAVAKTVFAAGYLPIVLLGICGIVKFCPRGFEYALCALPAFYFTALHLIFVSSIRYRQPAMLALAVLAAAFVIQLLARRLSLGEIRN